MTSLEKQESEMIKPKGFNTTARSTTHPCHAPAVANVALFLLNLFGVIGTAEAQRLPLLDRLTTPLPSETGLSRTARHDLPEGVGTK